MTLQINERLDTTVQLGPGISPVLGFDVFFVLQTTYFTLNCKCTYKIVRFLTGDVHSTPKCCYTLLLKRSSFPVYLEWSRILHIYGCFYYGLYFLHTIANTNKFTLDLRDCMKRLISVLSTYPHLITIVSLPFDAPFAQ